MILLSFQIQWKNIIVVLQKSRSFVKCWVCLKLSKCEVLRTTHTNLGHVVSPEKLKIEDSMIKSFKEALPPRNKLEHRFFLELGDVYRRFVQNVAQTASLLNDTLHQRSLETCNSLTAEQWDSFVKLIKASTCTPNIASPTAAPVVFGWHRCLESSNKMCSVLNQCIKY